MHKRVLFILGVVFLSIGILLGVIGAAIGVHHVRRVANSDLVTATIVHIENRSISGEDRFDVYVEYEVDGIMIEARLNWWSSNMRVGQSVDLLVDPQDPYRFSSAGIMGWLPTIILSALGLPFAITGAILFIVDKRKRRLHHWLLQSGIPVWANVEGTEANWSIQVNGRPATVLVATYNNLRFASRPLDNNDLMNIGERVKIFIHPDNANKYTFDLKNESQREPNLHFSGSNWGN